MYGWRIAIVGAGLMGRWHAHYAVRAGARVVAVIDPNPEAARLLAQRYPSVAVYDDLEACLRKCPVDIVHICSPRDSHFMLARNALRAGRHVLLEKPAAETLEQSESLVEEASSRDLALCPVHQFRHQRGFRWLQQNIARLGRIVRIAYHANTVGASGRDAETRREALLDILPHPFSLMLSLLEQGEQDIAWNVLAFTDDELELHASADGTSLHIALSQRGRPTCNRLEVTGTEGSAQVDLFHGYAIFRRGTTSRLTKLLDPFASGAALLRAASVNLLQRTLAWQPAYPGLSDLIGDFYRSMHDAEWRTANFDEILQIARWTDSVACQRGSLAGGVAESRRRNE
jgi:predicted dehydrogenase